MRVLSLCPGDSIKKTFINRMSRFRTSTSSEAGVHHNVFTNILSDVILSRQVRHHHSYYQEVLMQRTVEGHLASSQQAPKTERLQPECLRFTGRAPHVITQIRKLKRKIKWAKISTHKNSYSKWLKISFKEELKKKEITKYSSTRESFLFKSHPRTHLWFFIHRKQANIITT